MKQLLSIIVLAFLFSGQALASSLTQSDASQETRKQAVPVSPNEGDLVSHGHYTNKDGVSVHAPSKSQSGAVPTGASAQCRDGSYSFSRHHSGTCSRHGGVATWF